MIHIVVPSTTTLVERSDGVTKYTAFNIHINGWLHATIRYSLLHKFAETVRLKFGGRFTLPEFPPKKLSLTRLDGSSLDERRLKIAKYLQTLVQSAEIVRSSVVERTFLEFQLESYRPASSSVNLDVLLGDGSRHCVRCGVLLNTRDVMKVLSETLECDFDLLCQYFGLFLVRERHEDGRGSTEDMLPVRLLRNFESPYVSLQMANQRSASRGVQYKLQLRRMVWEVRAHERLIECPVIKELLFKQASSELSSGLFSASSAEAAEQLHSLKGHSHAVDRFLRVCTQQSSYGYEDLGVAECELYHRPGQRVECSMRVGRRQVLLTCTKTCEEWIFRATRVRIWRISQPVSVVDPLLFQMEYLVAKDQFEWITIHTDQAILLSLLLQSIGADILHEQHEAAKEAAREALSESDVISPLKMPSSSSSSSSSIQSTAHLSYPRDDYSNFAPYTPSKGVNKVTVLPEVISGTTNSTFAMDITDDDL